MPQRTLQEAIARAIEHQRAGRHAQAAEIWREVVVVEPNNGPVLRLFGEAMIESGRPAEGVDLLRRAVVLNPELPIYNTLGNTLLKLGRIKDAIETYRAAIRRSPQDFLGFSNLGTALMLDRRGDEAAVALRTATDLNPNDVASWSALVLALASCGKIEEGIAAARSALQVEPQSVSSLQALSSLLITAGELDAAESAARQAFALAPNDLISNVNLGSILLSRGALDAAAEFLEKAISLSPRFADAHINLGNLHCALGEVDAAIGHYRRAVQVAPANPAAHSPLLLALHYRPIDPTALLAAHRDWAAAHASSVHPFTLHDNNRDLARRLRVGFVSPDLRHHPVARFLLPLLQHHDKSNCEIYCYAELTKPDETTATLRQFADHWRNTIGRSDDQLAEQIRDDRIDILIDLAGHTSRTRLLMFARKPAPIQVTYLGYPNTTGLKAIDWRITDAIADPPGQTESLHTERLVRLPTAWCFAPPTDAPEVAPLPALTNKHITFGSFNNFAKVSETTLRLWSKVLSSAPNSRLIIKSTGLDQPQARQRIHHRLREAGIDPAGVDLLGRVESFHAHLRLYERIDIALDTFPYHGTTTTCEAMWMGVPVVTLAGAVHVSRVGVSLFTAAGLAEWIAPSAEQYAAIARNLAGNLEKLAQVRSSLRQRVSASALFDGTTFARNFESAMRQMWVTWLS